MKNIFSLFLSVFLSYVSFSQNVGIGTATPAYKLDVRTGSINTDSVYRISSFPVLSITGSGNLFAGRQAGQVNTGILNAFSGHFSGAANTTGSYNSFFGGQSGIANTTGYGNTFLGCLSGTSSVSGNSNLFIGYESGYGNISGNLNVNLGYAAGWFNETGNGNTLVGSYAGQFSYTGSSNTAVGRNALAYTSTGYSNVAVGAYALYANAAGHNVVAIGDSALFSSDNSTNNTAVGSKALFSANTGSKNTAVGYQALYANTSAEENVAVGVSALSSNIAYGDNVAVGYKALASATTAAFNVAVGAASMQTNNGVGNVAVGSVTNIGGSDGTAIGYSASVEGNIQYATAIGASSRVTCSNCLVLGGDALLTRTKVGINIAAPYTDLHIIQQTDNGGDKVRGIRLQRAVNTNHWRTMIDPSNNYIFEYNDALYSYVEPFGGAFVNPSDASLKTDIVSLPGVLDKLLLLQPKTYQYIATKDAGRHSYGFLAQDVEKLFPDFVFSGENGIKGIAYHNFSVIAIKAIQEQQEIIKALQQNNDEQKQKIDRLERQMEVLLKKMESFEKKN